MHFIKLNLQLDTKQFLLHVLLVQAASPPPVQAASPSPVPGLIPLLSLLDLAPDLRQLLLKFLMQLLLRRQTTGPLKLLLVSDVGTVEILPLHLFGRPLPRRLSTSSTSMMVLLVRARTQGAQGTGQQRIP